jgi:hypothetical protein
VRKTFDTASNSASSGSNEILETEYMISDSIQVSPEECSSSGRSIIRCCAAPAALITT